MAHEVLSGGAVSQWNASYYDNSCKRWIYGVLHLLPTALFFEAKNMESKNDPDNPLELFIKFSIISFIKKASSSFIYPSITVITTNNVTHWFSSFSHRDSALLLIEHFFHSHLLSGSFKMETAGQTLQSQSQTSSQLGCELLQNVNDTHETLKTAASKLAMQGRQLTNASCTMDEIHEDLGVATRITSGLDSWFGRWKIPKPLKQESVHVVNNKDIPYGFHFDSICCEIQGLKYGPPKECVLRLMKDGLTLLTKAQKVLHHFGWRNVSRIQVVSPWEIIISQFLIGKPDKSYTVTSVEMPTVLKELDKFVPEKMELLNFPNGYEQQNPEHSRETYPSLGTVREHNPYLSDECFGDMKGLQQMHGKEVTDEEMNQLSSTLSTLKFLALDIQSEEDRQLHTLDQLTSSVESGNDKLKHINKKIDKLLK